MYCRKCGQKLGQDERFCPKCGEKVIKSEAGDEKEQTMLPNEFVHSKRKNRLIAIRVIVTVVLSVIGSFLCYTGSNIIAERLRTGVEQKSVYATQHISEIYLDTVDWSWIWIFASIAVLLLLWNTVSLVKYKGAKRRVLNGFALLLSCVYIVTGISFGCQYITAINGIKEMVLPELCLEEHFAPNEVETILADLEQYGFYDSKENYSVRIEAADAYDNIRIDSEDGKELTSFTVDTPYEWDYFYENCAFSGQTNWVATVEDGHIVDIVFELDGTSTFSFVEDSIVTANPQGNYLFAMAIASGDVQYTINHSITASIAEQYTLSEEDIDLNFGDIIQTYNGIDLWKAGKTGTIQINDQLYKVFVEFQALTDAQVQSRIEKQEEILPFEINWFIASEVSETEYTASPVE